MAQVKSSQEGKNKDHLLAYALGLNPFITEPQDLPSPTLRETGGVKTVASTYRRSTTATEVDVLMVGMATLPEDPWETRSGIPLRLSDTADGQAGLWQMAFLADVPARFFQLRVVQQ